MKCWNIHRKDKYLVLLLIISNILNLISDTMSYSKPEQMNDQEFYISVLQVKCLSKFRYLNGSSQSHVREWESRNFETGRKKRPFYRKVGQYLSDPTLVLIFGLAFMESAKSFETFFPASIFLFDNWPKTIHKVLALTLFFSGPNCSFTLQSSSCATSHTQVQNKKKHFSFQNSNDRPRFN